MLFTKKAFILLKNDMKLFNLNNKKANSIRYELTFLADLFDFNAKY